MLTHHSRRAQISVVGNIDQHIRAIMREPACDAWIRRLDANENPGASLSNRHQAIIGAGGKVADNSSYQTRSRQPRWKRNIFTKRQQANLIILRHHATLLIYEQRRVKQPVIRGCLLRVKEHRCVMELGKSLELLAQDGIRSISEVHRRLGPHEYAWCAIIWKRSQHSLTHGKVARSQCFQLCW